VLTELVDPPRKATAEGPDAEIAREVFERVMAELEGRLAAAVASAIGELRRDLANTIGDAVKEALERRKLK
jgi:hypothetical protein